MRRQPISTHPEAPRLTARETELWRWLTTGQPSKWIAYEMGVGPQRICDMKRSLLRNLGVKTREDAVRLAARWGVAAGKVEAVA